MAVKTIVFAVVLLLVSACQWFERRPEVNTEAPVRHESLAVLIAYFVRVESLPAAALEREIAMMENRYSIDASPATRLCLAYLLGLAQDKPEYRYRAQQMLSEIEQELYTPADYKDLARFLARDLRRYAALREDLRADLRNDLRDELRDDLRDELRDDLRAEQQRRRQLQQQLDALKDIERKISERKPVPIDGVEDPKP